MLDWFRRLRKVSQKLSLPSRDSAAGRSQVQLNPSKLTPRPQIYLSTLACLFDLVAETLEDQGKLAPSSALEKAQLVVADEYRSRHKELSTMIAKLGDDLIDLEQSSEERLNVLFERTAGANWFENVMQLYLVVGMLEDSARRVSKGLSPARRLRVEEMLSDSSLEKFAKKTLAAHIAEAESNGAVLAMFGRAIIADALLEVRDSVNLSNLVTFEPGTDKTHRSREEFKALEPFTSELIANHAIRMDYLGLTA